MVEIEKVISRSEIFEQNEQDEQNGQSDSELYTLPPPGFDFEIVEVDDEGISQSDPKSDNKVESESEGKVEMFNMFSSLDNTSNLVKIKVDDLEVNDDNMNQIIYNDKDWDILANSRNQRPLNYYFQTENDMYKLDDYRKVAVDGQTILNWCEKFRIFSNYKVINLKEFNSRRNLIYKPKNGEKNTKNKRKSRKRRDAQIFKKERLKNWNNSLKLIQQKLKSIPVKDYTIKNPVKYTFQANGERRKIVQSQRPFKKVKNSIP